MSSFVRVLPLLLALVACSEDAEVTPTDPAEAMLAAYPEAPSGPARWSYETTLALGVDDGRGLGTVFQLTNASGHLLAAAGFVNGMQTTASNDGRSLSFFVGANDETTSQFSPVSTPVPTTRPFGAGDVFLLSTFRGELLAYRYHRPGRVRSWDDENQRWNDYMHPAVAHATVASVRNIQTVDNRLFVVYDDAVWFDDEPVNLAPLGMDSLLVISMAEYTSGLLHMSVVGKAGDESLKATLVTCRWSPASRMLSGCATTVPPIPTGDSTLNHLPSGLHGTVQGTLLTYGLQGDLFELDGAKWTPLRAVNPSESWQAYTSLDVGDDVLIGHYPTGNLFSLSRSTGTWILREQTPPVVQPTEVRRDEAQSLMSFGGDLLVGVWPWGEIYRGRYGDLWWPFIQAFDRSGGEPSSSHPYEAQIGNNCLGQRVFQIIPWKSGLAFSTTLKNNDDECLNAIDSLTTEQRLEYGQVRFVQRSNALSCPIVWVARPTKLTLSLGYDNRLTVSQDRRLLCSVPFRGEALAQRLTRPDNVLVVGGPGAASAPRHSGLYGPQLR